MPARIESLALVGLGAQKITVEVDLAAGLPSFTIVGLPDKAVAEARERVRAAIKNSGFQFPIHRITVNLAPADLPKVGPAYDLPIALAILIANGTLSPDQLDGIVSVGELSLSGDIQPVDGVLPMAISLSLHPPRIFLLPEANLTEAALVGSFPLAAATSLRAIVDQLVSQNPPTIDRATLRQTPSSQTEILPEIAAVHGLDQVKRVLEIAAAGKHNILLIGPPGTGKTLLARAFASLLPALTDQDYLEVLTIRSAAGLLKSEDIGSYQPPVRSPHHTASSVALVGGGTKLRPGEVSLAHRGVLFLDEFPEFPRTVLEALREPLEEGRITVARAQGAITFPARFILVAAANPCPCGYYLDPDKACRCSAGELQRYQRKLSGPLLDRLDLTVTVPRQSTEVVLGEPTGTSSATIRSRVEAARAKQIERHAAFGGKANGDLNAQELAQAIDLSEASRQLLVEAGNRLHLSGRAVHRLLKVSRTIADLADMAEIAPAHIAEALQYRQFDGRDQ